MNGSVNIICSGDGIHLPAVAMEEVNLSLHGANRFLERDIPQLGIRVPAATLRRFWTMVAHFHGQILNQAELARALGSSEPTARRYLDILTGTYVVRPTPMP